MSAGDQLRPAEHQLVGRMLPSYTAFSTAAAQLAPMLSASWRAAPASLVDPREIQYRVVCMVSDEVE